MKNMESYDNSVENPESMEVRIFPAADGSFTLWEDAGDTPEDRDENWAATKLKWHKNTFTIGAVQGNASVVPQERSWNLVFCGVEDILAGDQVSVTADGCKLAAKVSYDEEHSRLVVQLPAVEVSKELIVSFADQFTIADNRKKQCYEILQRAQMEYGLKGKIWNIICTRENSVRDELKNLDMNESVRACLLEVL